MKVKHSLDETKPPSRAAFFLLFYNFFGNGRIMQTDKMNFQQSIHTQGQTATSPVACCSQSQQAPQTYPSVTPGSKQKNLFAAFLFGKSPKRTV
ncbi:MAG: hypothetical protein CL608_17195 [Anaerolineaceae bacterium]|nr:hypothetical protein [Anaerolineaceae bacterium]